MDRQKEFAQKFVQGLHYKGHRCRLRVARLHSPGQLHWETLSAVCCNWWASCDHFAQRASRREAGSCSSGRWAEEADGSLRAAGSGEAPRSCHPSYHHQIKPPGRRWVGLSAESSRPESGEVARRRQIRSCWHLPRTWWKYFSGE